MNMLRLVRHGNSFIIQLHLLVVLRIRAPVSATELSTGVFVWRLAMPRVNDCTECKKPFWSSSGTDNVCVSCWFVLQEKQREELRKKEAAWHIRVPLHALEQIDQKNILAPQVEKVRKKSKTNIGTSVSKRLKEVARNIDLKRRQKESRAGYVYLMRSANGLHKIGRSKNVQARNGDLNRQFPIQIKVVHEVFCKDYCKSERELHHKYRKKCVESEWFDLSAFDVAWFMSLKDGDLDNIQ
jgi:uncharacterized Zn finger protein (UPF0148 family)